MSNKDLKSIHDEIWNQIYEQQKRTLEQQSKSTHSDMNTQRSQSNEQNPKSESLKMP